jgi:hypothetical protein
MSYGRITGSDVKAAFITADTDAASATAVCASQASGATADTLTINGGKASGGVATFIAARQVTLVSAANLADKTFTITGTDVNGDALTESLTGPNNNTVTSTKHFLTVTEIAFTDGTSGTMTAGFNTSALAVVFAGRTRLKGAFIVNSATGGVVSFRDSADAGESGTTLLQLGTVASAVAERDVTIPGEGVLFDNGVFIPYTAGTTVFTNMTVFRS